MNLTRQLARQINDARANGILVYAWPQRFSGRHLVYAARCVRGQLKVRLALSRWVSVKSDDVQIYH